MAGFSFPVSTRFAGVTSSPVRDLLAVLARGDVISFAGGIPDPQLFAVEDLRRAFDEVFTHQATRALQYSATEGEPELREHAALRLSRQVPTAVDQVQITSGSQEALFLVAQVMLDPGDVVLVERPTYLAAIQAFSMAGARIVGVASDEHGMQPDALEQAIGTHRPRVVYLNPTFQNPSGHCMPLQRREAVAGVLLRTGTALIEDDPYGELRFSGQPVPALTALPGMAEQSVLLNSLSKVMAPGVRVGWLRAPESIRRAVTIAKQGVGLHSPVPDQLAAAWYLANCDIDQHVRRVCDIYRERRDAMVAGLRPILPDGATVSTPDGGMFLWVRLGSDTNTATADTTALLPRAVEHGVAFVPGTPFYAHDPDPSTMRLSYVTNTADTIAEGLRRLAATFDDASMAAPA